MRKPGWYKGLILTLLALLIISGAGCIPTRGTDTSTSATSFSTYVDKVRGFSISYPWDWLQIPLDAARKEQGALVAFRAPEPEHGATPNFNVVIEEMGAEYNVETYYRATLSHTETEEGYRFISKRDINVDGTPAIEHTFSAIDNGDMSILQVHLVRGTQAWTISCLSHEDSFDSLKPTFESIVNSFRFTGTTPAALLVEATMTTGVDSDKRPLDEKEVFAVDSAEIHCSVILAEAPPNTEVTAQWIYLQGEEEGLTNYLIKEGSLTADGTVYLDFNLSLSGESWPIGDYEVVLYLNGVVQERVPFFVR